MNKADAAEALIERQLQSAYSSALQKILKQNKSFIKLMKDVADGKIQPPQFYIDNGLEERWKQGFLQQALRQQQIIQQIAGQLDKTGERAGKTIKDGLSSAYFGQYSDTVHDISTEAQKAGIKTSFGSIDKRAVRIAVDDSQESSPFSKIAYKNLGNNTRIRRQLQNEMAQAIMLGESQTKVIKRIRDVVGNAQYNAKRTAQTEGTRIRSQARERAQQEAAEQGVRIVNEWSTNMDGKARDQHEAMNGKMVKQGDPFIMPNGDEMLFPADPNGSAENVINCRCVLIPHVLAKDEDLVDGRIVKVASNSPLWNTAQEEPQEEPQEPNTYTNENGDVIDVDTGEVLVPAPQREYIDPAVIRGQITQIDSELEAVRQQMRVANYRGDTIRVNELQAKKDDLQKQRIEKGKLLIQNIETNFVVTDDSDKFVNTVLSLDKATTYRSVEKLDVQRNTDEIVANISGGDKTKGSCASVGLAYIGQQCGLDVLDFRDGESREWFGGKLNKLAIWDSLGVPYITEDSAKGNLTNGRKILERMEFGKEYYLSVGRHASIVRVVEGQTFNRKTRNYETGRKYQYLELQNSRNNGWTNFNDYDIKETLKYRFGCSSSSNYYSAAYLTDVDDLKGSSGFRMLIGYLNTAENEQRKGSSGTIK